MNEGDWVRLRHMLDAGHEVMGFLQGRTRASLDTNQLLVRGLSMSIGIIGEAAAHVSTETQEAHPQIPWAQVIGMRNRVIHAYFDIKLDRLWQTAVESVPALISELEKNHPARGQRAVECNSSCLMRRLLSSAVAPIS